MMDIRSDFHVHTKLSRCAPRDTTLQSQIDGLCQGGDGLRVLGISNHLWDSAIDGASPWYEGQNVPHVLSLREELEGCNTRGARVLVGAEVEMRRDGEVALTPENARLFDYILITVSHFHMKGLIVSPELSDPSEIRRLLIDRFCKAAVWPSPVKTGICHPFYPMSFWDAEHEILSGIKDEEYGKCFELAARHGISVEIHASVLRPVCPDENGFASDYMRMLRIARECGCSFHIGSDVHAPNPEKGLLLRKAARAAGIEEKYLTEF